MRTTDKGRRVLFFLFTLTVVLSSFFLGSFREKREEAMTKSDTGVGLLSAKSDTGASGVLSSSGIGYPGNAATISSRISALASDKDADPEGDINSSIDSILDEFYEILPEGAPREEDAEELSVSALFSELASAAMAGGGEAAAFFSMLLGICLIFLLGESAPISEKLGAGVTSMLSGILSIPIFERLFSLTEAVRDSLEVGSEFFSGLIPIATAVTALGGGGTTAAAEGAGMSLSLGFVSGVLLGGLLPIVGLMMALSALSSLDAGGISSGAAGSVKGVFNFILGLVSLLLPATLALQSVISSARDSMAMRSLKYAAGSMIPIVGGTVSGTLATLVSGAGYLSGIVGALSVYSLISVFLSPLVLLLAYRLAFKLCIDLMGFVGSPRAGKLLSGPLAALDALISVLASAAVIYLLEVIIFMKSAVTV